MKSFYCLTVLLILVPHAQAQMPWKSLPLWPGGPPNEEGQEIGEEGYKEGANPEIPILQNVSVPTLSIYRAEGDDPKPTVLVCPGGAYNILADGHEGTEVAKWLNAQGYHALLLRYRVPRRENRMPHEAPLEDARRALRLGHENAKEWGVDSEKLGILGFSAGGNLAARATYQKGTAALPKAEQPDFAILIYPAYLLNDEGTALLNDFEFSKDSPPAFFAHAHNDRRPNNFHTHPDGSVRFYLALSAVDVASELHIFSDGKHGFGTLDRGLPVNQWPTRCQEWLAQLFKAQ